jgi:Domain of unknown function (DUF333)
VERTGPLGMPVRFWAATVLAVAAAVLLVVGAFGDDRQRAQKACVDQGGQVVIQSDPYSIGQRCVFPNGSQVPL